jgi:hypothetical protein
MKGRCRTLVLLALALFVAGVADGQQFDHPFAPGDTFSISHTPMSAKLVPVDCDAKKIPIHSYKHSGNEATFLIPEDSPSCTYEVMGTRIRVERRPETKEKAEVHPPRSELRPKALRESSSH